MSAPLFTPLDVMVDVQTPPDWRTKAEEHRMMARAAIRVAPEHRPLPTLLAHR